MNGKVKKKSVLLFDLDGTLIETQGIYDSVVSEELSKINKKYTIDYCIENFNGMGWREIFYEISKREPNTDMESVFQQSIKIAEKLTKQSVAPVPNASKVLERAKKEGFKMAICSNSPTDLIKHHLKVSDLWDFFNEEDIFGVESVKREKPAPDIYQKAVRHFNAKESDCIAIEDSSAGLVSASLALIDAVFYKGGSHNVQNPKRIDSVFSCLNKLEHNTLMGSMDNLMELFDYL